jgi:hypothetical protein
VAPASGSANSKAFYCALLGRSTTGGTGTETNGTSYLNLTTPTSSLLYRKPNGQDAHGGGGPLDAATLTAIAKWITEGAYYTEGDLNHQTCP